MRLWNSPVRLALALAAALVFCQAVGNAQQVDRRKLFAGSIKGCVGVMTAGGPASGWVVDVDKRWIVTCQHVVAARDEVEIIFPIYKDGKLIHDRGYYLKTATRFKGKVLGVDAKRDLSLIQVDSLPKGTIALRLADDSGQPGEDLHLIGNPAASGAMWNYTTGTLRAVYQKRFTYKNTSHEVDAFVGETQLPANPGDSGGAVFNDRGEVLGVHSGGSPDGVTLMATYIDVAEVKQFLSEPLKAVAKVSSFDDLYNAGNDYFQQGQNDKAIDVYTQAIKLKPEHADVWRCRASVYIAKKMYDNAIDDCNRAIRLDKTNARALNERAVCHGAKGNLREAVSDYTEAIRIEPGDAMFWAGRAWAYNGLKEFTKALSDATEAIRLKNDFALPYRERSVAHQSLGNQQQAETDLRRARQLDPAK